MIRSRHFANTLSLNLSCTPLIEQEGIQPPRPNPKRPAGTIAIRHYFAKHAQRRYHSSYDAIIVINSMEYKQCHQLQCVTCQRKLTAL